MPTANRNTEASRRVSGDSKQNHILRITMYQFLVKEGSVRIPIALRCGSVIFDGGKSGGNRHILAEHSVKFRPPQFHFTGDKCNLIYAECVEVLLYVFFTYSIVLKDKRKHRFISM